MINIGIESDGSFRSNVHIIIVLVREEALETKEIDIIVICINLHSYSKKRL